MHSQITIIGEMGLIDLSGIVDDTDAGRLHDWIVDLRLQGTERVVVDLTELTWVRRSARASLIEIAELLEAEGGRVLIGASVVPIEDLLEGLRSGGRAVSNPALRAFFAARTPLWTLKRPSLAGTVEQMLPASITKLLSIGSLGRHAGN
jgi:anti-anti-sigma regulatory factor